MAQTDLMRLKTRSTDFERLWGYSVGFYGVWLVHIGRQTGLLAKLARNPMSVSQLISSSNMHPRAVEIWCYAAISYMLVSKTKGKLYVSPSMKAMLLDKKNPEYLGGQFSYLALRSLQYRAFEKLFKWGVTNNMYSTFDAIEQATDWDHYAFLTAIKKDNKLHQGLSKGFKLLDVGCGTGSLIRKLRNEYPRSRFVGIEPSTRAVALAKRISKTCTIVKQTGESMTFKNEFDIVYLGESLYAMRDKRNVISNCRRALKKDGTIAIVEGLLPESNVQSDDNKLIMGMQLDFALQGHEFMTRKQISKLLYRFSTIRFKSLGGSVYLVTARR
jgi:ubiquinone/menaquinone biosynthesis C-methylase UbiE